ncbi:MAG: hypothetical protein ACON5F_11465 [Jejuia sp.]
MFICVRSRNEEESYYTFNTWFILAGFYFIWTFVANLNREVTSAFEVMNERLTESYTQANSRLDSLYLSAYKTSYSKEAHRLNTISKELTNYIDDLKEQLVTNITDPTDYEVMDASSTLDSLFFNENGSNKKGDEFIGRLKTYKAEISQLFKRDFLNEVEGLEKPFLSSNTKGINMLEYHFKGFPLVASLTKLTQIQADIKSTEKEILMKVLSK